MKTSHTKKFSVSRKPPVSVSTLGLSLLVFGLLVLPSSAFALPLHTGDTNVDENRDVLDINCMILSALSSAQGLPSPDCQALSNTDIDLQCDDSIDVTDVQRLTLLVLHTLTGDEGIEALLQVKDFDMDYIHNDCDPDDDNDSYPDLCEISNETNPFNALDIPTIANACTCPGDCIIDGECTPPGTPHPDFACFACVPGLSPGDWSPSTGESCEDGNACTVDDACDAGLCMGGSAQDCGDGNLCTDDSCSPVTGCIHSANTEPCSDSDVCTLEDVCTGGTCVGGPANSACDAALCTLAGEEDDEVMCPIRVARQLQGNPAPTGLQLTLDYNPIELEFLGFKDTLCILSLCVETLVPPAALSPSGHTVILSPESPEDWFFGGSALFINTAAPTTPISEAFMVVNQVVGDATFVSASFRLREPATPESAFIVSGDNLLASTADSSPMEATVVGSNEGPVIQVVIPGCAGNDAVCNDGNPCTEDVCDGLTKSCTFLSLTGPACDDNTLCTSNDFCDTGLCVGTPIDCDDNNNCTTESCNALLGCTSAPIPCDDGDSCTDDTCVPETGCAFTDVDCDDGIVCTLDACLADSGTCFHDSAECGCLTDADCEDANSCTETVCAADKTCEVTLLTGDGCDDSNACTSGDTCTASGGCTGALTLCEDGDACTVDGCDSLVGCTADPLVCEDGNACTGDSCDPATGCTTAAIGCDDGDSCTGNGCNPVSGCVNQPISCDDGDSCTVDSCDVDSGCTHDALSCGDGDACTDDTCDAGTGCANTLIPCGDDDACTDDTCDAGTGCANTPVACGDADACTNDSCDPATGCANTPIACGDGDACTDDTCDAGTGCANTPIACGDADACTDDTCDAGTGCANTAIACGDADACTADSCDPATGCANTPIACGDADACTDDTCDPAAGCTNTPIGCEDGDACTDNGCDIATGCTTTPVACDDQDPCTADSCAPGLGCENLPIPGCGVSAADVVCEFSGADQDTVTCQLHIARSNVGMPEPTAVQFSLNYDPALLTFVQFQDEFCPLGASVCFTVAVPPQVLSPTGHSASLNPQSPGDWVGTGGVILSNSGSPETPITNTYVTSAGLSDEPSDVLEMVFILETAVSIEAPALVTIADLVAATATADPMVGWMDEGVIIFALEDCADIPQACDDGNLCSSDLCAGSGICDYTPLGSCDDGNACTVGDSCATGTCESASTLNCDDSDACTVDSCGATECENVPIVEGFCDDGNSCTVNECSALSGCIATDIDCDDIDSCTADSCVDGGCVHTPIDSPLCAPEPACDALCTLSGSGSLDCLAKIAAESALMSDAVGLSFNLSYDSTLLTLDNFYDDICFAPLDDGCSPFASFELPITGAGATPLYPGGHSIALAPSAVVDWDGFGSLVVANQGGGSPVSKQQSSGVGAYSINGDGLEPYEGDPVFVTIRFTALAPIAVPTPICISDLVASDSNPFTLDSTVNSEGVIITSLPQ